MGRKFIWKRLLPAVLLAAALYLVLGAVLPFARCPAVTEETRSAAAGLEVSGGGGERVRVVADSGEALRERVRLISQAEERLILSTFDIRADDSGKDVLCALLAAADRGVEVKMLVDGFCGLTRMAGNEYFIALSAHENAEVRIYNPIRPWIPWTLMARLHDKYLIADDAAYLLGGRNTHDAFLGDREGNHDWDVLVWREEPTPGDSLDQLLDYFGRVWSSPDCRVFHDDTRELGKRRVMAAGAALRERYVGLHNVHPDWLEPVDYGTATLPTEGIRLITNPIHTGPKEPTAFYAITELMGRGERSVTLHTPYVIADDWMLERLAAVCGAVPTVTLLTNSVANNGNPFGAMDYRLHKGELLDTGTKILEYDGGRSYHGKCFTVDGDLSAVGSFNWDMRSACIDTELMLVIRGEEVNAALRREMERYEGSALTVLDDETSLPPPGHAPQVLTGTERILQRVLGFFTDWARFLM